MAPRSILQSVEAGSWEVDAPVPHLPAGQSLGPGALTGHSCSAGLSLTHLSLLTLLLPGVSVPINSWLAGKPKLTLV